MARQIHLRLCLRVRNPLLACHLISISLYRKCKWIHDYLYTGPSREGDLTLHCDQRREGNVMVHIINDLRARDIASFSLITSLVCALRARFSTEMHQGPSGAMFSLCSTLNNKHCYLSAFSFQSFTLTRYFMVINPTE